MGCLGIQCVHGVSKMIVVFGIILALVIDKYYGYKLEKDILKRLAHKNKKGKHKFFENNVSPILVKFCSLTCGTPDLALIRMTWTWPDCKHEFVYKDMLPTKEHYVSFDIHKHKQVVDKSQYLRQLKYMYNIVNNRYPFYVS